jgi:copper homeostasis protein
MIVVEVCVDSPAGVAAALRGGADRIELCSALALGGLTPSPGLIAEARRAVDAHAAAAAAADGAPSAKRPELVVLIRPRPGDFVYDQCEARVMLDDVAACARLGADSVAIGALAPARRHGSEEWTGGFVVDAALLARLALAARAAALGPSCFHRAFDLVEDRAAALETLIGVRPGGQEEEEAAALVGRVLTSGGAARAGDDDGCAAIAALVGQARGRGVEVVAAGGIRADNVAAVVARTGARQVHSSALPSRGVVVERPWRRRTAAAAAAAAAAAVVGGAVLGSAGAEAQDEWRCADEGHVRELVREARRAAGG